MRALRTFYPLPNSCGARKPCGKLPTRKNSRMVYAHTLNTRIRKSDGGQDMLLPKAASSHRHIFEMGFELEQVCKYIREQETARSSDGPVFDRVGRMGIRKRSSPLRP